METLNVRVVGGNAYFKLGIISLIDAQSGYLLKKVKPIPEVSNDYHISFDMHKEIVSIKARCNESNFAKVDQRLGIENDIFIPFNCRDYSLYQLESKLRKLLEITTGIYILPLTFEQVVAEFGLKKYLQLSNAEITVMVMMGQGLDCHSISKTIDRSSKTIQSHYRSACRKLGFNNQADFFRFANLVSIYNRGVIYILCL